MKKIVIACTVVLASAAMLFVSCAPKSCDCTYSDGEDAVTVTIPKATMDALKLYTTINNCKDLQDYYNSDEYDSDYHWTCK